MNNEVIVTEHFERDFKRLKKKFRTLKDELLELETLMIEKPETGTKLGNGLYKIRLASKSKPKGKSGGFRIITYLVQNTPDGYKIYLVAIYDKSEESTVLKSDLMQLIRYIFD